MAEEVLAAVLAADNSLSRDEPEVAANIGQQLEHMGLTTWSISVRRRIRDSVARLEPKKIIQTELASAIFRLGFSIISRAGMALKNFKL